MSALDDIRARRSISRLDAPAPTADELRRMLVAAASAPDHGELRPWRFIVLEGAEKDAFGSVLEAAYFARCEEEHAEPQPAKAAKERTKLGRAPLVVVVAVAYRDSNKVPTIEQFASAAAAAENLCLAATSMGYGTMWRTGVSVYDPRVKRALGLRPTDDIAGFVYIGTVDGKRRKPPHAVEASELDALVSRWAPPEP